MTHNELSAYRIRSELKVIAPAQAGHCPSSQQTANQVSMTLSSYKRTSRSTLCSFYDNLAKEQIEAQRTMLPSSSPRLGQRTPYSSQFSSEGASRDTVASGASRHPAKTRVGSVECQRPDHVNQLS
jgi:hypothetical protein